MSQVSEPSTAFSLTERSLIGMSAYRSPRSQVSSRRQIDRILRLWPRQAVALGQCHRLVPGALVWLLAGCARMLPWLAAVRVACQRVTASGH